MWWEVLIEDLRREPFAALTALGTLVLAGATYWLGRKTRDLATTSSEEMELLRESTAATRDLARFQEQQVKELALARIPVLNWQSPSASVGVDMGAAYEGSRFIESQRLEIQLVLRNDGGPARLHELQVQATTGETFVPEGLSLPTTLPAQEAITLKLRTRKLQVIHLGERVVAILLRYTDLYGEFSFETGPSLHVKFVDFKNSTAAFVSSDEHKV